MSFTKEAVPSADLGEVAETGMHLPAPTDSHDHDHHDDDHDHEHGFEILDVLRVVFVALAAAAVWFHFGNHSTESA